MSKLNYMKRLVLPAVAVLLLAAAAASRAETPPGNNYLAQKVTVDELGNAQFDVTRKMTADAYQKLKSFLALRRTIKGTDGAERVEVVRLGNTEDIVNFLDLRNLGVEIEDLKAELLDAANSIHLSFRVPGWARNQGKDCWQGQVLDSLRWLDPTPYLALPPLAGCVPYEFKQEGESVILTGTAQDCSTRVEITLPKGASRAAMAANCLSFCMPVPAARGPEGPSPAHPEFRLDAKPVIQAALYRDYANPRMLTKWLARTRLDNKTNEVLRNCKVRYSLALPELTTAWVEQDLGTVYPGQTLQWAIYPAMQQTLAGIVSRSNAIITVQCKYERPGGQQETEEETARFDILGVNDSIFSTLEASRIGDSFYLFKQDYATMAAAFVTGRDPLIQELKDRLIRELGGLDVRDKKQAMRFIEKLYDYFRGNIAYTLPPGTRRHGNMVQHLSFGRNVLQSGTGTCVDLAILFASVVEAAGLEAHLVSIPGHCFPAVKLPGGDMVYVETTGCGAGTLPKSLDFKTAQGIARANYIENMGAQTIIDINIRLLRKHGMKPTELPALAGVAPRA